jgi:phage gpG-like protein
VPSGAVPTPGAVRCGGAHARCGGTGRGHLTTIPARPYPGLSERQKELPKEKVALWLAKLIEGK